MAIARDTSTAAWASSDSVTYSHTCTGSDLILIVGWSVDNSRTFSSCTYNGVSMTQIGTDVSAGDDHRVGLAYLVAPATGANNIILTLSGSGTIQAQAASYTGAAQSGQPDNNTSETTTDDPNAVSLTVNTADSWMLAQIYTKGNSTVSAGSNTSLVIGGSLDGSRVGFFDTNSAQSTGSQTMNFDPDSTPSNGAYIVVSIAPPSTPINSNFFAFM